MQMLSPLSALLITVKYVVAYVIIQANLSYHKFLILSMLDPVKLSFLSPLTFRAQRRACNVSNLP